MVQLYAYSIDPPNSVKIIIHEKPPQAPAFQCVVDANPPPSEFTWKRSVVHSISFPPTHFLRISVYIYVLLCVYTCLRLNRSNLSETGGLLELVKVGPDFSGLYSCEVSNPYGAASGFLYVHKGNGVCNLAVLTFNSFI